MNKVVLQPPQLVVCTVCSSVVVCRSCPSSGLDSSDLHPAGGTLPADDDLASAATSACQRDDAARLQARFPTHAPGDHAHFIAFTSTVAMRVQL